MYEKFHSARLKTKSFKKETPYVVTRKVNHRFKDWLFEKMFPLFQKWGHFKVYMEDVVVETFDFTESKKTKITEKIIEEINLRECDHYERITPDKYIILMGEDTFFEYISEERNNSPFFGDNVEFMSNDIYYHDPYNGKRAMQFSCHIVRGMKGFAFVPKVILEVKKNGSDFGPRKDYTI